jgi:putative nucleotidyltransferase with HDIG domain
LSGQTYRSAAIFSGTKNATDFFGFNIFLMIRKKDQMDDDKQSFWIRLLLYLSRYIDSLVSDCGTHSSQVAQLVETTARKMECKEEEIRSMYWAALLHDIGKIGVPDKVLSKAGPLTDEEWDVMKLHPAVGSNIVQSLKSISHIAPVIYAHQEKYDGSGYPQGLQGEQIPLGARILTVVDAYDAMTSDRHYRKGRSHAEATQELVQQGGKQFDPQVVEAFLDVVPEVTTAASWA